MEPKEFFVGIYEPSDVRRNVLEASKDVVETMQAADRLRTIRNNKLKLYDEMREVMSELDMLVTKLNKNLPKTQLRKTSVEKKPAEIKKLETDLRRIETEFEQIKHS